MRIVIATAIILSLAVTVPRIGSAYQEHANPDKQERNTTTQRQGTLDKAGQQALPTNVIKKEEGKSSKNNSVISESQNSSKANSKFPVSSDWMMVILTLIYVLFTAVYACASIATLRAIKRQAEVMQRQTKATETAANAAKESLIRAYRAKIIVRNVVVRELEELLKSTPVNEVPEVLGGHFHIANIGGRDAKIDGFHYELFMEDRLPMELPYDCKPGLPANILISAGTAGELSIRIERTSMTKDQIWKLMNRLTPVFFMGWIRYADDSHIVRRTVFCRRFDSKKMRFCAVDDPDYEHAD